MSTPPSKIQVTCSCGALLAVSAERAGATVTCPQCARPVAVPAAGGANWYVARDKQKAGPYSSAQLKGMAAAGQLRPDDMLLREGQMQWVMAGTARGLFPEPVPAEAAQGPRSTAGPAPGRPKRRRTLWLLVGAAAAVCLLSCAGGGLFVALILASMKPSAPPAPQAKVDGNKQVPSSTPTVAAAPTNRKGTGGGTGSSRAEPARESTIQDKLLGRWEATRGEIPPGSILELTRDGKLKMTIKVEGKSMSDVSSYVVQGEAIKTTHKEGPREVTETLKIKTLTEKMLVTEDEKGKTEEFKKLPPSLVDAGQESEDGKSNREQALEWIRNNNAFGPEHQLVKDVKAYLDSFPDDAHGFQLQLGAGLAKSGKATLLVGWRRGFWVFDLSAEQGAKMQRAALQRTMMKPLPDMGEVPPDFAISPPVFDAGSSLPMDRPITGRLPFRNLGRESEGYPSVRLTHWPSTAVSISYSHYLSKFVGKEDREFKFKFGSLRELGCAPGPVLFVIDVVEFPDDMRTGEPFVVSNPVAVLVTVSDRGEVVGKNDGKRLTAEELTRAFKDNEDAARKKYGDLAAVTVEGVVKEVFVNKMGEAIVYLKGATDGLGVACSMEAGDNQEAAKLKAGQKIVVAGKGYGIQGDDVLLGFCKLLPAGGKPDMK
jgi:uncharacterized protein (TIGR03066 family)